MSEGTVELSALVVAHNEEALLEDCLKSLSFADELVVLLDRCTDGSRAIAVRYADRLLEGAWAWEGVRCNTGIAACRGVWILEVDADERVPPELAAEVRAIIGASDQDWHEVPVDNYVGTRLIRWGWGGTFGTTAVPRLFRKGTKVREEQRIHPALTLTDRKGPRLANALVHLVDRDISDMLHRLDRYTTAKAQDLRANGNPGSLAGNLRRVFSRFFKCYVRRKGYREGGWGVLLAVCAGLYPLLSYLKATLEDEDRAPGPS